MSIASEISRIQQAKADIKTAIEAKGVTVPSSATIDTYDDYVSQISGGLSRTTSGTPYCTGYDLYVDVTTDISIDGGASWVESGVTTLLVESGSSQCARLPQGYTEVEYIENVEPYKAYIDTGFKPNQNTRVIADLEYVATNMHPRAFGCGDWDGVGYIFNAENGIPGEWKWKFGYNDGDWLTTYIPSDFNRHKVEFNNGNLYLDDVVIGSTTVTTFQLTDNIGLFCFIQNGSQGGSFSGEYMFGKFYSFKIYDDGVLTMDFVPCINPNNVVGMYDIVGGAFYSSANEDTFVAGPVV